MTALEDWNQGVPVSTWIPVSTYSLFALFLLSSGLFTAGTFAIQSSKTPLSQQVQTALMASILLGFGTIFASNAAGVYV
ncbi:hypothetical protein BDB01DRAFT_801533 [Pilobolus umbonatus]|nr:hypothetical protein BDB01DRAFT_801533 [Pilobolus umbonatus]